MNTNQKLIITTIAIVLITILSGFIINLLTSSEAFVLYLEKSGISTTILLILLPIILVFLAILTYLSRPEKTSYDVFQESKESYRLKKELEELKADFSKLLPLPSSSNKLDIDALTDSIREQALSKLSEKVIKDLENKYAMKSYDAAQIKLIRDRLAKTATRFDKEIYSSNKRINLNLAIGISVTLIAASILGIIAFEAKPNFENSMTALLAHYIPRITTIIFIEVFAFFFLRLYKSGLQEIKYFQNELTNIEMQQLAIEVALIQRHNKPLEGVIEQLAKTERNPIKQLGSKEDENNLSPKDITSIIETVSKVTGKS